MRVGERQIDNLYIILFRNPKRPKHVTADDEEPTLLLYEYDIVVYSSVLAAVDGY